MERLRLSVVVCAYTQDRWEELSSAVESLLTQGHTPDEVIVVVDYNEALAQRAAVDLPQQVRVLTNEQEPGLSGARNTGVRAACGDVIAFLDDDARALSGWAAALLAAYRDPRVVGVGGHVLPDWRAPRPDWFPDEFLWVVGCSYAGQPQVRAAVRNAIGANMSFRSSVFSAVGGFDPSVGRVGADAGGCEETEFSIRARGLGTIVLEPDARCLHTVTADRTSRHYFRRRCRAEGRSKAVVATLQDPGQALETERAYVARTLPVAVIRGLRQALGGDLAGGRRSAAVVEGLIITASAYIRMRMQLAQRGSGPLALLRRRAIASDEARQFGPR